MNSESAHRVADRAAAAARPVVRPVDMPDVVNNRGPSEASSRSQATCRHHLSINDSSSSSAAAAAARREVVYVNRDDDDDYVDYSASAHQQPLPDLVNVHRPHAPPPYDDRPPTSSTCHARATAVNHYVPPSAVVHSPAHCYVRRTYSLIHSLT